MTVGETGEFDKAVADALDRYTVRPLSAGFADRVVALALGGDAVPMLPVPLPPRRDRRRGWARGRQILIGAAALSLLSAGAAATGIFGDAAQNVPLIGPLIAIVAPAPRSKAITPAKPKPARGAPKLAAPLVSIDAPPIEVAQPSAGGVIQPGTRREIRREMIAQRVVDGIERRAARGKPLPPAARAKLVERLSRMPPRERRLLLKRIREVRDERRAGRGGQAIVPAGPSAQPSIALRRQLLSPEARQRLRQERRLRRFQRPLAAPPLTDESQPTAPN